MNYNSPEEPQPERHITINKQARALTQAKPTLHPFHSTSWTDAGTRPSVLAARCFLGECNAGSAAVLRASLSEMGYN